MTELQESRKQQLGDLPDAVTAREEISKKIQALIAERNEIRDKFNNEKREFQQYLAEQRKIKQERYAEERKKQQEEWNLKKMEKQVEALDEQPFVSELTLIEQTVLFCKGLMPQDPGAQKEEKKETVFNNKDGETVLLKKEDREMEFY